jgi:hypothetical protein
MAGLGPPSLIIWVFAQRLRLNRNCSREIIERQISEAFLEHWIGAVAGRVQS